VPADSQAARSTGRRWDDHPGLLDHTARFAAEKNLTLIVNAPRRAGGCGRVEFDWWAQALVFRAMRVTPNYRAFGV